MVACIKIRILQGVCHGGTELERLNDAVDTAKFLIDDDVSVEGMEDIFHFNVVITMILKLLVPSRPCDDRKSDWSTGLLVFVDTILQSPARFAKEKKSASLINTSKSKETVNMVDQ